jgi:branched-chain amino acid transport system substrate-binding protein
MFQYRGVAAPPMTPANAGGESRNVNKNLRRVAGAIAAFTVISLGAAGCSSSDEDTAAGASELVKIGFMGDLTGPNKALGINILNGAKLAIDQYNATNPEIAIELVEYDSQGDPKQATALAPKVIDDGVVGLVGPAFSGETADTGATWEEAGLPFVSASATRVSLAENGWTTFHRVLADDGFQGPGVANFLANGLGATTIAVVDDASEYGKGLADETANAASSAGATVAVRETVAAVGTEIPNYSSVVSQIKSANVDAVFYGGYYAQSGALAKQLKDGGVTAPFVSGDGSLDPAFVEGAGDAANGAYLSCTCALVNDAATGAAADFYTAYTEAFSVDPGTYSPEGFDAATAFINGIKEGKTTSADLLPFISGINFEGVSKQIQFEENGNIKGGTVLMYKVEDGKITPIGTTDDAKG